MRAYARSLFAALLMWCSAAAAAVLEWPYHTDPRAVGYRAYTGTASRDYSQVIDVGNTNQVETPALTPGLTYYFAVTVYTADGLESPFSDEVDYTVPLLPLTPPTRLWITGTNTLTVMTSIDLHVWTAVTNITLPGSTNGMQFYKAQ